MEYLAAGLYTQLLVGSILLSLLLAGVLVAVIAFVIIKVIGDNQRATITEFLGPDIPPLGINILTREVVLPQDLSPGEALDRVEQGLRRFGVFAMRRGDLLVVEGMVPWVIRASRDGGSLRVGAFVKEWVAVLTLFLIITVTIAGVLLGVYLVWSYMRTRDALRAALQEILGPEAWRYL